MVNETDNFIFYFVNLDFLDYKHKYIYLKTYLGNYSSHRSLSGCPRANKPRSRPKDGAESEPLR